MFALKTLMCTTCPFLSCKLPRSFSTFSIFILSGKMVNQFEVHIIFQDIENQLEENILHHFLRYSSI